MRTGAIVSKGDAAEVIKTQESKISVEGGNGIRGQEVTIRPNFTRSHISMLGKDDGFKLSVEEAFAAGKALIEHALECGYNPETGQVEDSRKRLPSGFTLTFGRLNQETGIPRTDG